MKAYLFESLPENRVRCHLCNHRCVINEGKRGICAVRQNRSGVLHTLVYEKVIAQHVDPIEKKPLFHFFPGSLSYSIATVGCNFKCRFCQNADIAQMPSDRAGMVIGDSVSAAAIVQAAVSQKCRSIAYTYTEPTVYFELAHAVARKAKEQGIYNIFVTNGYMSREALEMIQPYLDAANVDLKAFTDGFYKRYCGAKLKHVKETLVRMKTAGVFVEVTTLIIPGLNDDPRELADLASFLVTALGPDTPWHISRFHPTYQLTDRPATPLKTLLTAREIGLKAGLKYVYTGNVPGEEGEKTFCASCGKVLIDRWGFAIKRYAIVKGRCPACGAAVDGVFDSR
ncbi:MAG: AmmeMemoRadiSam system radical SAM enzyme [Deltaproteobacteria bacterium]|jgi:pyruvate formate lyase activating enzyme